MYFNNNSIAILMSTYNGEKYLSEQLDSILSQKLQDFTLFIRDDGSSDHTMTILRKYCSLTNKIVLIESNENVGATRSFLSLLSNVESHYYMFCDQDDVWYDYKVSDSYEQIVRKEHECPNKPVIVYTDLSAVDSNLKIIIDSMWEFRGHPELLPHSFNFLCHYNDIDGCTMIFNDAAKKTIDLKIEQIPSFVYHDWLIALNVSNSNGLISPLPLVTMKFRRHNNNETKPTDKKKSVIIQPFRTLSFLKEQYNRFSFCEKIKKCGIVSFSYYKIAYVFLREFNNCRYRR